MSKMIDAETFDDICYDGMYETEYRVALERFDKESVEAEPVRHGRWIHDETGANYCSECRKYPYDDGEYHLVWHTNYCPHCGAKMDGGADQ